MFRLLAALCLVPSMAWAAPAPKIDTMEDADVPMVRRALAEVFKTCDRLAGAKSGISEISLVQKTAAPGSDAAKAGWTRYIFITFKFSDNSSFVPRNIANNPDTQQAYLSIGGSPNPGIYVSDPSSHYGCGDFLPFHDRVISVPSLKMLDRLHDD